MTRTKIEDADREAVAEFIERHWQSRKVMSRGREFFPHEEQGFIERRDGVIAGLLTYRIDDLGMEMLTLNSVLEGQGIGSSLILDAIETARREGCKRIWLTTTNDRLRAIGFYQRLGFHMIEINVGAVDEARKHKPQIPKTGERGVEIHDEVVMDLVIQPAIEA